jgi:hypothetical protein
MKVDIRKVKPNQKNPRVIKDNKFKKLVSSIKEFPEMLELRPIVVDSDMVVLGGNMRLKACQEAGLSEVHILVADKLTEQQKDEFIIKDNVNFGEWDWDVLANEWDIEALIDWALSIPNFGNLDMLQAVNKGDENSEWVGMPEFESIDDSLKIIVHFQNEEDREEFSKIHKLEFIKKQAKVWSTKFPFTGRDDLKAFKYE